MSEEERNNEFLPIKNDIYNKVFDSFDIQNLDEKLKRVKRFFLFCRELSDLVKQK